MMKSKYEFIPLSSRTVSDDNNSDNDDLSLDILYSKATAKSKKKSRPVESLPALNCWRRHKSRSDKILYSLVLGLVLCILLVLIAFSVYYLLTFSSTAAQPNHDVGSAGGDDSSIDEPSWRHQDFQLSRTDLSMIAHDVDRDGIQDIIFATVSADRIDKEKYLICPDKENSCMEDFGIEPCQVRIFALNGQNGELVWEKWLPFSPFAINCNHDLNADGIPDCTLSGRNGAFTAITPGEKDVLWYIDPAVTIPSYNYYYPLIIRDFDNDGTTDIIITHGGDPVYADNIRNRSPGYILVISGRTGQQLSDRILMPDGHETYNSPITYNVTNDIELILFGSGGETISGSLWGITVQSLQDHVNSWAIDNKPAKYQINKDYFDTRCLSDNQVKQMRPKFQKDTYKYTTSEKKEDWIANCPVWKSDIQPLWNVYGLCVYEVMSTDGGNGYIVPPVIIDNNGDGVKDLLVSPLNDHVMMIDGTTYTTVWDHHAQDTQSYSIPSPFHYNDDDIPDYVLRLNKGKWLNYDYSYLAVIDGSNGDLLWSLNCSMGAMGSAITVKSKEKGHDGILFVASGCEEKPNSISKRETELKTDDNPKHQLHQSDEDTACLTHSGLEQSTCNTVTQRYKRHNGDHEGDIEGSDSMYHDDDDNDDNGYNGPQVLRPMDIDFSDISDDIPTDIWGQGDDAYPDPWTDTRAFVRDYCGIPYDRFVSKMYFLTPSMMKINHVKPILVHSPHVQKFSESHHFRSKRHSAGTSMEENQIMQMLQDKKNIRCAHVMVPMMQETTPTLGDFNHDGKLEVAASVIIDGFPSKYYPLTVFHPSKVSVDIFTIEDELVASYGEEIRELVDFSSYYSMEEQPWGGYMGSRGNGIFEYNIV